MRHLCEKKALGLKPAHAALLLRNLVTSLLLYEKVRTTKKRARAIQPMIDRLIVVAKKKEPQVAIRAINRMVTDKNASYKMMEVLKTRYEGRSSGFTRMVPAGTRLGDGAALVDITLIAEEGKKKKLPKTKKAT